MAELLVQAIAADDRRDEVMMSAQRATVEQPLGVAALDSDNGKWQVQPNKQRSRVI